MDSKLYIDIHHDQFTFGRKIYIYEKNFDGSVGIAHAQADGRLEFKPYAYSATPPEPTLVLTEEVLTALTDTLVGDRSYKPKEVSRVEGMYEEQTKHLEDLRFLLKLPQRGGQS